MVVLKRSGSFDDKDFQKKQVMFQKETKVLEIGLFGKMIHKHVQPHDLSLEQNMEFL